MKRTDVQISDNLIISSLGCAFHIPTAALLIADLHVGYEAVLEGDGFAIPRCQTDDMLRRIETAMERFDPAVVVVNGDFKHSFNRNLRDEWNDVDRVVEFITRSAKITLLRGNHDNYLAAILVKRGMQLKDSTMLDDIRVEHGHRTGEPWSGGMIFGHEHPTIRLHESTGASVKMPCFLYDRDHDRLVLPAFSSLAPGYDILRSPDSDRMIPLLAQTGIGEYVAYGFTEGAILNYRTIDELRRIRTL